MKVLISYELSGAYNLDMAYGFQGIISSKNNSGSVLMFLCTLTFPLLVIMHTYIFRACRSIPQ
jgi:hypothetical protein